MVRGKRLVVVSAVVALLVGALAIQGLSRPERATTSDDTGSAPTEVSVELSRLGFPVGADVVFLASAESLGTARTAGSLRGGPVLLTPACGGVPEPVGREIERLSPDTVVAVGDAAQLCGELLTEAGGGRATERLAPDTDPSGGDHIRGMAVAIARYRFPDGASSVYLVGPDDAEAALAAGMLDDGPTLVVGPGSTPASEVRRTLDLLDPDLVVALGAGDAVPDAQLDALAGDRATERLGAGGPPWIAAAQRRFGAEPGQAPVDAVVLAARGDRATRIAATVLDRGPVVGLANGCGPLPATWAGELRRLRAPDVVPLVDGAVCDEQVDAAIAAATVPVELDPDARVLSAAERAALAEATDTQLRFTAPPPSLGAVREGTVLVAEASPAAPGGLLRRVTGVEREGTALTLGTEQAAIDDALREGVGSVRVTLTPDGIGGAPAASAPGPLGLPAVPVVAVAAPLEAGLPLDRVLYDVDGDDTTTEDRVVIGGTIDTSVTVDAVLDVSGGELRRFRFAVESEDLTDLAVDVGSGVDGAWRDEVANIPLTSFRWFIGLVPVVLVAELQVSVGSEAAPTATLAIEGEHRLSQVQGVEYTDDQGWETISQDSDEAQGSASPPAGGAAGMTEGWVRRAVATELFSAAGPNVYSTSRFQLHSQQADPRHRLLLRSQAGVAVAVNLPFVGTVVEHEEVLYDRTEELWRGGGSGPPAGGGTVPGTGDPTAGDPRYDLVAASVAFGDRIDLAARVVEPRAIADWSPDDWMVWQVVASGGGQRDSFFVTLQAGGVKVYSARGHATCASRPGGDIVPTFDGVRYRVSIGPDCVPPATGLLPSDLRVGAQISASGDGQDAGHLDNLPDAYDDVDALLGPIRAGESGTACDAVGDEGGELLGLAPAVVPVADRQYSHARAPAPDGCGDDISDTPEQVPDAWVVVRGGTSAVPPPGQVFSGSAGRTVEEAAAGVPHGQIRITTAGSIRADGGAVEHAPELTRAGNMNDRHVNVRLGPDSQPFGELQPNPVPRKQRIE